MAAGVSPRACLCPAVSLSLLQAPTFIELEAHLRRSEAAVEQALHAALAPAQAQLADKLAASEAA